MRGRGRRRPRASLALRGGSPALAEMNRLEFPKQQIHKGVGEHLPARNGKSELFIYLSGSESF